MPIPSDSSPKTVAERPPRAERRRPTGAFGRSLWRLTTAAGGAHADAAAAMRNLDAGMVVDRRYRVLGKIGEGGMGAVYKVEHLRMGKWMALKILLPELAADASLVERFESEARIASKLSSPNTVSVFDFGEIPDCGLYMAMEFVPGRDLATLLAADGPFHEQAAVGIAVQVLGSLAEAHDAGIIHRDIKPPNIMLLRGRDARDFAKVLDFGIATLAGTRAPSSHGEFAFVGTPEYASPEQVRGDALDARSDLYSLGAMLFELLSGSPPFVGKTPTAVLTQHLTAPPPLIRDRRPAADVSPQLQEILLRALAKEPADRFASADEMRAALEALLRRDSRPLVPSPPAVPAAGDPIAQRGDWDAFEAQLRRAGRVRKVLGAALGVAVVSGGLAVAAELRKPAPGPVRVAVTQKEREPNNGLAQANILEVGRTVEGHIGARLSDETSDLDSYLFHVARPSTARITVTAVPNVNVALKLYQRTPGDWRAVARVDDQPLWSTAPEVMDDVPLAPGDYVAQVSDRRGLAETTVRRPRENSTDAYQLTVELAPRDPVGEVEPDNTPDGAMPVDDAHPVRGHTGTFAPRETANGVGEALWSDDYFAVRLSPGATRACALLVGTAGAGLRLELPAVGKPAAVPSVETRRPRDLVSVCAPATSPLLVRVEERSGADTRDRYLLTVVDDGATGSAGLAEAARLLAADGRKPEADALVARAGAVLPSTARGR